MQDIDMPRNYEWKTKVMRNVRAASESTGRVWAVSYNIAGGRVDSSVLDELKKDWMSLVDNELVTQSGRYIRHNNLPVLRIYGIGFKAVSCGIFNNWQLRYLYHAHFHPGSFSLSVTSQTLQIQIRLPS